MILRQVVQTKLVMKIASTPEMVGIALNIKPDYVTLVPEKREEFTAEGGLDLTVYRNAISETIETLQNSGIPVCVSIDPEPDQISLAHQMNVTIVEIRTRSFCDATTSMRKNQMFSKIVDAIKLAHRLKMVITVGQGLCYGTIRAFRGYPEIQEFVIGHSIVARAVMVGMENAVKEMVNRIRELQIGLRSG
jgi:pyridoxine 5-phosphate synthase